MNNGIRRSRHNKVFGGIAGGLAEYFDIDISIMRILFVLFIFFSGIGVFLYLIMWVVIPQKEIVANGIYNENSSTNSDINFASPQNKNSNTVLGVILITIGVFLLSTELFSFFNFEDLIPLLLVGAGAYLLWKSKK